MNITIVSISTKPETCKLRPFHCLTVNEPPLPRGTLEKVERAAVRRNQAVREALQQYPETTHVFMVDSWYLRQTKALERLIQDYEMTNGTVMLGASSWCAQANTVSLGDWSLKNWSHLFSKPFFYDTWVTPEGRSAKNRTGLLRVKAVGAAYLFPVSAWKTHPFAHDGLESENTYFCRVSGLACYLSFNARVWHPYFSLTKRLRVKLAMGRWRRKPCAN